MGLLRKLGISWLFVLVALACAPLRAQEAQPSEPVAALAEALGAACRQNAVRFEQFLTADNAAAFRQFTLSRRVALMKRLVLLDDAGQPAMFSGEGGRRVLRCETGVAYAEMRFGDVRVRENLAFIPLEVRGPGGADADIGRRVTTGLVREGGGWKLLSVGLLLMDLPALARQWDQSEMEASEAAAIADLRKIAAAIGTYRRAYGKMPETPAQLGPAPRGSVSPQLADLLDGELAAGKKDGYVFRCVFLPPPNEGGEPRYELAATPAEYGKTGRRSFYLDSSGTLRGGDKQGAVATSRDPRIER